jgi:uncharacterized membrane protein
VLITTGLPYQAVEWDPVNLLPYITTFNICSAGRLILSLQDDVSLLSQTESKYSRYYTLYFVVFYLFYRLGFKYSIGMYLLIILNILLITHTY